MLIARGLGSWIFLAHVITTLDLPLDAPDERSCGECRLCIDACPTRDQDRIHNAIRTLADKMNINIIEPESTKTKSICCGDSFYGEIPVEKVELQMKKRASQMPVEDVIVYCISCTKAIFIGGKKPHYMVDLLFGEETIPKTLDLDLWHTQLDEYIAAH